MEDNKSNKIYFIGSYPEDIYTKLIYYRQGKFPIVHIGIISDFLNKINPLVIEMMPFRGISYKVWRNIHNHHTPFVVKSIKVTEEQYNKFWNLLNEMYFCNLNYDYLSSLGITSNKSYGEIDRFFDSELPTYLLSQIGIDLYNHLKPYEISPKMFMLSPLLNFEYFYDGNSIRYSWEID